jgi:hypothetical protein
MLRRSALSSLQEERSHPMFNFFRLLASIGVPRTTSDRERDYLNAAVSRFDLERREREIDRGLFRTAYPSF